MALSARRKAANKAKRERAIQFAPKTPAFPVRAMGHDPGTSNYGWSAMEFTSKAKVRVIRCGMLTNMIKELLGDYPKTLALPFRKEVQHIIDKARPKFVGIERYVPRRQGLSNESVNYMIGHVLCHHAHTDISFSLMLAATWKNNFNKLLDIEAFYLQCRPVPDHVVDSVLICLYAAAMRNVFNTGKLRQRAFLKYLERQIKATYR